jgi:hypothetical protein
MDQTVQSVLDELKSIYEFEEQYRLKLGLEDGSMPDVTTSLGDLYKRYRCEEDKILYLLLSKEWTVYGYIWSIIRYIKELMKL